MVIYQHLITRFDHQVVRGNVLIEARSVFLIVVMLLISTQMNTSFQDGQETVLALTNVPLPEGEDITREIVLEPFAPHRIQSSIIPCNASTNDAIVRIEIFAEGSGLTLLHRRSRPDTDINYTPYESNFLVTVRNTGIGGDITFNLTITQIGHSEYIYPDMETSISFWLMPIILVATIPLVIVYCFLVFYKRHYIQGG